MNWGGGAPAFFDDSGLIPISFGGFSTPESPTWGALNVLESRQDYKGISPTRAFD